MYIISGTSVKLTRGDSFYCQIGITDASGDPYVMQTGDTVRFYLKRNVMTAAQAEYADKRPLITKIIPSDTLILHLDPEDTKSLSFGEYVYDLELTYANGDVDTFINNAPFTLVAEVG